MKYEKKKKLKSKNKNNYKKKANIKRELEELIEITFKVFIDFHDSSNYRVNQELDFTEKDMRIAIDSSIISLFGNINACKILYSLKEIPKEKPAYVLDEKLKDDKIMDKVFILKSKRRYV